jgi:thiol-disulfide isomerase/thioredoxin
MSLLAMVAAAAVGVVAALALVVAVTGGNDPDGQAASVEIATFEFLDESGSTATLADFEGEPLVVNFFASWCAPCRAELPDLEKIHRARRDSVTFLGVNHDLDEATWRSFVDETEITFPTVFQPDTEIFTALDAKGMPSTAFVSPDGEVLHLHTGLLTDDLLVELIDEHLGGA